MHASAAAGRQTKATQMPDAMPAKVSGTSLLLAGSPVNTGPELNLHCPSSTHGLMGMMLLLLVVSTGSISSSSSNSSKVQLHDAMQAKVSSTSLLLPYKHWPRAECAQPFIYP